MAEAGPSFTAPEGACDIHFHVFGSLTDYPVRDPNPRYEPPLATVEHYRAFADRVGIERMIFVQPSAYGSDNACQLDAVAEVGQDRARAVVGVENDVTDEELDHLAERGACGIRVNVGPIAPYRPGLREEVAEQVRVLVPRCQRLGWHLDFLFPEWLTEAFLPEFRELKLPFTIAHLGMFRAARGPEQPGFQQLLDLVANGDGYAWLKLTAPYRISDNPDLSDYVPMGQGAVETAPNRVLWGSDFPHVSHEDNDTVSLFNLLGSVTPSEQAIRQILVDNAVDFYGF